MISNFVTIFIHQSFQSHLWGFSVPLLLVDVFVVRITTADLT